MRLTPLVRKLVELAVEEDLSFGDVTASCCIPPGHLSSARIIAREDLVLCGTPLLPLIIEVTGSRLSLDLVTPDGTVCRDGDVIARLSGETQWILSIERTALNLFQRLSGVATHTSRIVAAAHGITVLDTRKTLPGWRVLEKYAVTIGGGRNHRMHLGDAVLIKNNHIDAHRGDLTALFDQLRRTKPWYAPVECEVRTFEELERILPFGPDFLLLDNMDDATISRCLARIRELGGAAPGVEVSGNLTPERLPGLREIGVECISMGALTTKAVNVDISLRIEHSGD
jgi:nicotinate-nucleotide pyrophosphorylase (carboxylating)